MPSAVAAQRCGTDSAATTAPPEPGYPMQPAHREAGVEANAVARVSEAHPGLRANQPADPGAGFALTGYAL